MGVKSGCEEFCIGVILGLYRGHMGIMDKNMETTIMGYIGFMGLFLRWPVITVPSWEVFGEPGLEPQALPPCSILSAIPSRMHKTRKAPCAGISSRPS